MTPADVTRSPTAGPRLLAWEACRNARDLGGYRTGDGGQTAWGALVRSDSLTLLTDAGRACLLDYGVRQIIDLRTAQEVREHPNPFAHAGGPVRYLNVPLADPARPAPEGIPLAQNYAWTLAEFRAGTARVMAAIADAGPGGVLVHCFIGKDRTGLVSALLLEVAGVVREDVAADYALSAESLRAMEEEWLAQAAGPEERRERAERLARYRPRPEVMLELLDLLDRRHGGVEGYLSDAGLRPDQITALRSRLRPPG